MSKRSVDHRRLKRSPSTTRPAGRATGTRKRGRANSTSGQPRSDQVGGRALRAVLPALRRETGHGLAVVLAVAEGVGQEWDLAGVAWDRTASARGMRMARHPGGRTPSTQAVSGARTARVARVLAALASVHRLQILTKLLEGPGTYGTLQKATRLKAGPLYHHIGQLRIADLIGPKERDLYDLTRGGRNLALVALALPRLMQDRRPRPQPRVGPGERTESGTRHKRGRGGA